MKLLRAIVAAVLFAASFHAVAAAAQGYEVQEADLDKWITKNNAYVKLLNESLRARDSWDRYLSWVNLERGPTGKERIIYGLYSVGASSAKESIAAARKAADSAPSAPALDAAAKELAATFETVFPIMNEANDYYDRKDYMSDNASGAKRLHGQLVPAARAFMAARDKMENLQEELKDKLDGLELARIEKTEGKQYRWHMKRTMTLAKEAVDLMPKDPRHPGDMKDFDSAIMRLADAAREFDAYVRNSGKSGAFDHYPRDIVGRLREIKEKIAKRQADPTFYSMDYNGVVSSYNMMIDMARMPAFGR
jgi:hypothetical protein